MTGKKVTTLTKPLKAPTPADSKFHSIKSAYAANSLSWALESGQIMEDDKFLIEKHVTWLSRTNVSMGRLNRLYQYNVDNTRKNGFFYMDENF